MIEMKMSCPNDYVDIDNLLIPQSIKNILSRYYKKLTPPQAEAVSRGLFKDKNMLIAAPTASGKTLIAYMALINAALNGFKGVYTTPLKALASEKYEDLQDHLKDAGLKIGISTGDYDNSGEELSKYDIIITTYERLDSLLRLRPSWFNDVKTLVIDEIHVLGDEDRGAVIEMIVTRAMRLNKQVIALSATIGNPEELGEWLNSEIIICNWRPVPLIQGYFDKRRQRIVFEDNRIEEVYGDLISHNVSKTLKEDYQLLIFKQSRRDAENTATRIASEIGLLSSKLPKDRIRDLLNYIHENVSSRIEREILTKLIGKGVAFHHAGLSLEARRSIEKGFRERIIKVVVATPTLAAGVNLPARRVIVYTHRYERGFYEPISILEYKQMGGRAGRPQYDPYGEIIIADLDPETATKYIRSPPEDIYSTINNERSLRIHLLALIASRYARNINDLVDFMSKTFYSYKNHLISLGGRDYWRRVIAKILKELEKYDIVEYVDERIKATKLGELISTLYIDPLTYVRSREILEQADAILNELYALQVITLTPDFLRNINRRIRPKEIDREIVELIDKGALPPIPDDVDDELYITAFAYSKALTMWINEVDEDEIMQSVGIPLGDLRVAIETATWISYALSKIFVETDLKKYSRILNTLSKRLESGVKEELLILTSLRGIGRVRARSLYKAGVRNIDDLKKLSINQILSIESINRGVIRELCQQIPDALFCEETIPY
ncbi:MAG: DEAD/DEAH box helicase [Sulfolobales archaeon]